MLGPGCIGSSSQGSTKFREDLSHLVFRLNRRHWTRATRTIKFLPTVTLGREIYDFAMQMREYVKSPQLCH